MAKRKICIIVASRANYGRIKSLLEAVEEHPDLELQLIVGASGLLYRFGQVVKVIEKDGFQVTAKVYSIVEGENLTTMAKSTGLAIQELATLFENLRPDVVVTVADRFETMGTAVAASYMNICLAHTQGGEVSGSIDESVRHAISKLAHLHFPANEQAAGILKRMGEDPARIFVTGCPAIDLAARAPKEIGQEFFARYGGVGPDIQADQPYLVVLQHPVTTEFGQGMEQINHTLSAVIDSGMQAVWLWPNVDAGSDEVSKGLRMFRERNPEAPIHFYRNFTPEDYVTLIANAACLVGNSSSGIREGAFLGTPVVNIGSRQADRTRGPNVADAPHDAAAILAAIRAQASHGPYPSAPIYGDGTAGKQMAQVLATAEVSIQKKFVLNQ
ncbi:MAG: UDP-N-acetylglucosamine 2-epimerase (hydrolyzing) [Desulfarculaceae bacterium]|nr:UDP-N-acetylglucosamine 2-epimerase (hydrolyzing) [Desulfarculaceae bacterium]